MNVNFRGLITSDTFHCIILFLISVLLFASFVSPTVGGDSLSMYIPAKQLISENQLNMWDGFNDVYNTYYFKFPFTDEAIIDRGESYPIQNLPTIFIYAIPMVFFGDSGFIYANPFMAALIVAIVFLITRELEFSKPLSTITALALATMPLFMEWAIVAQNIIPASLFFCTSLLFILKGIKYDYNGYFFLAGMFLALSIFSRTPHALLGLAFIPFFLKSGKWPFLHWRKALYFLAPIALVFIAISIGNLYYFGDPFFQGYLQSTYHPDPLGVLSSTPTPSGSDTFLGMNIDISLVGQSVVDLIFGSTIIYFPLLIAALFGLSLIPKKDWKLKMFIAIAATVMVGYYSQITPILYTPSDLNLKYSLPVTFFRYLIPVYILAILGIPFLLNYVIRSTSIRSRDLGRKIKIALIIGMLLTAAASVSLAYNYQGGASLKWYSEISTKMADYSENFNGKIATSSAILYDSRWGLQMTYQDLGAFHWFYYDGIPPASRYLHTNQVVEQMLADGVTVYFLHLGQPYDVLSKDMEISLAANFTLISLPSTYFLRLQAEFYQIMPMGG